MNKSIKQNPEPEMYKLKEKDFLNVSTNGTRDHAIWWNGYDLATENTLNAVKNLIIAYKKQCVPKSNMWTVCNSIEHDIDIQLNDLL